MKDNSVEPSKKLSPRKVVISYGRPSTSEDKKFSLVASELGRKALEHHFSKGRPVIIGENGKVIKLYKNNRKVVVKG